MWLWCRLNSWTTRTFSKNGIPSLLHLLLAVSPNQSFPDFKSREEVWRLRKDRSRGGSRERWGQSGGGQIVERLINSGAIAHVCSPKFSSFQQRPISTQAIHALFSGQNSERAMRFNLKTFLGGVKKSETQITGHFGEVFIFSIKKKIKVTSTPNVGLELRTPEIKCLKSNMFYHWASEGPLDNVRLFV